MVEDFLKEFDNLVGQGQRNSLRRSYRHARKTYKDIEDTGTRDPLYKEGLRLKEQYSTQMNRLELKEDLPENSADFPIAYRLMKTNEPFKILLGAKIYAYGGRDPKKINAKLLGSLKRAMKKTSLSETEKNEIRGFLEGGNNYGHMSRDGGENSGLTKRLSIIIFTVGILGGLFFLYPSITGNVVVDLPTRTTSFLGVGLLVIGLMAGFFLIWDKHL